MKLSFQNNSPIYLQLMEQIRILIISEKLLPGQRLPSVREWSIFFSVNPNTLQKALTELEGEGLVYAERTSGRFVTSDENLIDSYKMKYAKEITEKYLQNMKEIGYELSDIFSYLKESEENNG